MKPKHDQKFLRQAISTIPLRLRLGRDLRRLLKRGHPWVFAEALRQCPTAAPGTPVILLDHRKGEEIGRGFYDSQSALAVRMCTVEASETINDTWAEKRFTRALSLRQTLFFSQNGTGQTTGFRLFNGEGDGLPGLVVDVYGDTAVLQLDGDGANGFWHSLGIAEWVAQKLSLKCVYERPRTRGDLGRALVGIKPTAPIAFLENRIHFTAEVVQGQKTGFFLDQRENRQQIRQVAAGKRVLNLFGYTGGFSVYAGLGGASHVTTVDLAKPAIETAKHHWQLNGLPANQHQTIVGDAFEFLEQANKRHTQWELVIIDPPSFASAKKAVPQALTAYQKLVAAGASATTPAGLLAMASCSSHVTLNDFLEVCTEGISTAKRRATVLVINGQPPDHPTPLALPEFRYLKFVLMRVE